MYLATLEIENFRLFGDRQTGSHCELELDQGVNVLVGPNDAGKSCIIDAVRLLLGTSTSEYFYIGEEDFHESSGTRAKNLQITGVIRGLSQTDAGAFLEYLGVDLQRGGDPNFYLKLWLTASLEDQARLGARRRRVQVELRAGPDQEGARLDGRTREALNATYLRPLRDAVNDLTAKRGSRLSQVLRAYKEIVGQDKADWDELKKDEPTTLVGIMRKAEHELRKNVVLKRAEEDINQRYLREFSIGDTPLAGRISPSPFDLQNILERLELVLSDGKAHSQRGLGIHNLLFIATELLALGTGGEPELPLVLIEEPEAHLEPQRQLRLVDYLLDRSSERGKDVSAVQVLMTTHSPNLASRVPLKSLFIINAGRVFSLRPAETLLDLSDYAFLERFLDVTKANLFFARGVIIVEGDAEALLLPAIAELLGRPLNKHGVSIVKVGHIGLFRYSRIFRRKDGQSVPVPIACVADRDIPPQEAKALADGPRKTESDYTAEQIEATVKRKCRYDGDSVRTFVSPCWTLEFDIAETGLAHYLCAASSLVEEDCISRSSFIRTVLKTFRKVKKLRVEGLSPRDIACRVYEPFVRSSRPVSKPEAAQWLARLLLMGRPKDIENLLPKYLIDAVSYATNGPASPEVVVK